MKNLTLAWTRTQVIGFSSADALPTKLRVPVDRTWILFLIGYQIINSLRCLLFMWTFILDMLLLSVLSFFIIFHCWFLYIIQQFSLIYVVFESTLLNYANPCRNWTFQRIARAAQKKWRNGTNEKNMTLARNRNQVLGFSSADALPTKLRLPVGRTWISILIGFQILDSLRCLALLWTFIFDILLLSVFSFFIIGINGGQLYKRKNTIYIALMNSTGCRMYKKQDKSSMMSSSTNFIIAITEEGDRVVENLDCFLIVIKKFVDQDIIEFLSCSIYIYIYIHTVNKA